MSAIVPRLTLDPADWKLSSLAIYQPTDLLSFGSGIAWIGAVDPPGTRIEAELIPLTPKAISMIHLLPGHQFACQAQLFEVVGGYVTHNTDQPLVVSITCKQIHDSREQPILSSLMLEPQ